MNLQHGREIGQVTVCHSERRVFHLWPLLSSWLKLHLLTLGLQENFPVLLLGTRTGSRPVALHPDCCTLQGSCPT